MHFYSLIHSLSRFVWHVALWRRIGFSILGGTDDFCRISWAIIVINCINSRGPYNRAIHALPLHDDDVHRNVMHFAKSNDTKTRIVYNAIESSMTRSSITISPGRKSSHKSKPLKSKIIISRRRRLPNHHRGDERL